MLQLVVVDFCHCFLYAVANNNEKYLWNFRTLIDNVVNSFPYRFLENSWQAIDIVECYLCYKHNKT